MTRYKQKIIIDRLEVFSTFEMFSGGVRKRLEEKFPNIKKPYKRSFQYNDSFIFRPQFRNYQSLIELDTFDPETVIGSPNNEIKDTLEWLEHMPIEQYDRLCNRIIPYRLMARFCRIVKWLENQNCHINITIRLESKGV